MYLIFSRINGLQIQNAYGAQLKQSVETPESEKNKDGMEQLLKLDQPEENASDVGMELKANKKQNRKLIVIFVKILSKSDYSHIMHI